MAKAKIELNSEVKFGAILEDINSKFDILIEGNKVLNEKVDRLETRMDRMENRMDRMENRMENFELETRSNFQTAFNLLSNIDDEIKDIKLEITDIKKKIANKTDINRTAVLEKRVKTMEAQLLKLQAV
ncbi:hypothetical protein KAS41_01760 [Candidatus Parcubacteria bacterium]|nr:hypothetical protein [Candidatus Parcubacteria bacterium]